jgi:hypothetical protein
VKVRASTVHHAFVVRLGRVYDVGSGFTAEDLEGEVLAVPAAPVLSRGGTASGLEEGLGCLNWSLLMSRVCHLWGC